MGIGHDGTDFSAIVHRDSERQLHFDTKFEHEEMVLVAKKCFAAGGNGLTFDARCLLDF